MKKKLPEIILPVIITILFTFLLQYFTNFFNEPNGTYKIINVVNGSESLSIIELDNKSKKTQNNLRILIERTNNVTVGSPNYVDYKIEKSKTDTTTCLLTIFKHLPLTKSKIILKDLNKNAKITFSNPEEIKYVSSEKLVDKQLDSLRDAIITTLIYGLVFGLFYMYFMYSFNQNTDKTKLKSEELEKRINEIKIDIEQTKKMAMKQRLIQMAKVRDYEKELNFWKTVVSKILLENKSTNDPKYLFNKITEELKTYGTKDFKVEELTMAEYIDKITKNELNK